MADPFSVILKVFLASFAVSLAIKYGGPYLPITPTTLGLATTIVLPSIVIGLLLLGRSRQSATTDQKG